MEKHRVWVIENRVLRKTLGGIKTVLEKTTP
jgi:hypothetical protein